MNKRMICSWTKESVKEMQQARNNGDTSAIVIWNILEDENTLFPAMTDVFLKCEDENLFIRDIADYFCELAEFEVKE